MPRRPPKSRVTPAPGRADARLESRVAELGQTLARRVNSLVSALPGSPKGPVPLARAIGVNKVLTSRLLRAAASPDPVAILRMMPGPEPLRQFAHAAGKVGIAPTLVIELVRAAEAFEELIRVEAGDRSGFDVILAAWLPEARGEFELRRKQAVFRAISQLRGQAAETHLTAAFVHLSADPDRLDIVWAFGLLGLQRLRPGVALKFATRRVRGSRGEDDAEPPRRPLTLDGEPVDGVQGLLLPAFSSDPPPPLWTMRAADVVHYALGDDGGFGPRSAVDLTFAEVNRSEMPCRVRPEYAGRLRHFFAEANVPAKRMIFDVLVHAAAAGPGRPDPTLYLYDTAFDGVANVNDPARDLDRLDLTETIRPLGVGLAGCGAAEVPWYPDLLQTVCDKLGWDAAGFRGYRCRIDYPIYGSQVVMAFPAPVRAAP